MSTASYNCPCCGGPLKFSGESGRLECAACGNSYEPEALEMLNASESGEQISFERPKEGFRAEEGVQAYLCKNCGAELITEDKVCPSCRRKMKQQFIGLQHCQCGMSWKRDIGFFERTPDMVFGLRHNAPGKKPRRIIEIRQKN